VEGGRGERRRPRAGEAGGRAASELGWAKTEKSNESFFFFFSQYFKAFSNGILKFYLSFQIEHIIQNIMQQHECSIMFLPLYLILN
jgi:hypothetical protein